MTGTERKKIDVGLLRVYVAAGLFSGSVSAVISSMGFGAGVVSIVQPIHAPIANIATKAIATGVAISQNLTSSAAPKLNTDGKKSNPMKATAMITHTAAMTAPIA